MQNPRQLAFLALRDIQKRGAYTDIALDRVLRTAKLNSADRSLVTELVYGSVRRMRSLDALIDQLGKKKAHQQPPDLRTILHIGLYQLRYQSRIPASAAVNTTVELAKENGFKGLAGVVNGLLRQYERLATASADAESNPPKSHDPLQLPEEPVARLGILHSFPDWIIKLWVEQLGIEEAESLCEWLNQSPTIDLRVNLLRVSIEEVEAAMQSAGVDVRRVPHLPQALRVVGGTGAIQQLPGFNEGWWTIQDSSAQLVSHLLNPKAGDVVIDACAAPGGKTTHIAELMGDEGKIWACDTKPSRLKKVQENAQRLQLQSIQICTGDSRNFPQFINSADAVLLDAPCSGNGTLHRRPDIRWRVTPATVDELSVLQGELLEQAATWVKPGGILVYATCTLHPQENERVIQSFLERHSSWQIEPPLADSPLTNFATPQGWMKVWSHRYQMDGFFMVRLKLERGEERVL
ncbi:16S rRNA (cytosine(967)-C(5))-methyltransferase [Microcoleus sp. FACHB-SPT15]|jgi:16S rRNA (cytosine967-C5)-methyltransferase|uniref:16S rRNA (cytosine(967)-C(5))-methyltransferase n=1 Tax=Microcoleus sp. FACHB-SPT15 TaxID=2692830 RepID=UPI00177B560F|nr:16S rRNA (cytosine(967)-C(5))-methyltransferase [Microcoleus sp. FACHB-SPT15]MBD1809617.1 16S rRNA (cytosine(967)-C(5))-methyltransferase [Microcoleus sp. FACHB-SPT15]